MKLREIFNRVNDLASQGVYEAEDFLESLGAVFLDSGAFSRAYALDCGWGQVVIKFAANDEGEGVNQLEPEDRKNFPLLWRRYLKPLFRSHNVVIQPKVAMYSQLPAEAQPKFHRGYQSLTRRLVNYYSENFDAHYGNVGLYRGKVVIFDALVEGRQDIPGDGSGDYSDSYSEDDYPPEPVTATDGLMRA